MSDLIERAAAQTELMMKCERYTLARESNGMGHVEWSSDLISVADAMDAIRDLPSAQSEIIRCKDCKYFELDHFEKVEEFPVPIIVAHEICMKWSDGCRTSKDGWCFMGERRTDE